MSNLRHHPRLWHKHSDNQSNDDDAQTFTNDASNHHHASFFDCLNACEAAPPYGANELFVRARMRRSSAVSASTSSCFSVTFHRSTFLSIVFDALVVGQEFSLSVLLLARHRLLLRREVGGGPATSLGLEAASTAIVLATLLGVVYLNEVRIHLPDGFVERPGLHNAPEANVDESSALSPRCRKLWKCDKITLRLTDGLLLAGVLRLLSGLLRSLTASYSSDTVSALVTGGLVVHLLACDYCYANGIDPAMEGGGDGSRDGLIGEGRPKFRGGTVSLNAALFSTTLLASRLESDGASYWFLSMAVGLFAFYPATRHAIAACANEIEEGSIGALPAKRGVSSPCLLITITLSVATFLLLEGKVERIAFLLVLFCVILVSPAVKWWLQRYKRLITGPWDIAHITVNDDR